MGKWTRAQWGLFVAVNVGAAFTLKPAHDYLVDHPYWDQRAARAVQEAQKQRLEDRE